MRSTRKGKLFTHIGEKVVQPWRASAIRSVVRLRETPTLWVEWTSDSKQHTSKYRKPKSPDCNQADEVRDRSYRVCSAISYIDLDTVREATPADHTKYLHEDLSRLKKAHCAAVEFCAAAERNLAEATAQVSAVAQAIRDAENRLRAHCENNGPGFENQDK